MSASLAAYGLLHYPHTCRKIKEIKRITKFGSCTTAVSSRLSFHKNISIKYVNTQNCYKPGQSVIKCSNSNNTSQESVFRAWRVGRATRSTCSLPRITVAPQTRELDRLVFPSKPIVPGLIALPLLAGRPGRVDI